MTLIDFWPRWPVGFRLSCSMSIALSPVVDVLSGVPMAMRSPCRHVRSASVSALHSRVHSPVQTACSERAMPAAWWAFAGRQAAPCAAPPGHRIPVLSGREKMQGKIKGRGTLLREKTVCTWGRRGTRRLRHRAAWIANALSALSQARASHAWLRQPWMGVAHEPQR
ncbi:hypothetical protein V0R37_12130 [Pollutimonas sp. H1-120]|uniref:hypothetical protein n=1 Tax=Pollutimonas sp. H1-120 TaxID=3148824 RepID=UPI003B51D790